MMEKSHQTFDLTANALGLVESTNCQNLSSPEKGDTEAIYGGGAGN